MAQGSKTNLLRATAKSSTKALRPVEMDSSSSRRQLMKKRSRALRSVRGQRGRQSGREKDARLELRVSETAELREGFGVAAL